MEADNTAEVCATACQIEGAEAAEAKTQSGDFLLIDLWQSLGSRQSGLNALQQQRTISDQGLNQGTFFFFGFTDLAFAKHIQSKTEVAEFSEFFGFFFGKIIAA